MHPRISSSPGYLVISLSKQSPALLPDDTSSGISANPVTSLAGAKNKTFISYLPSEYALLSSSLATASSITPGQPCTSGHGHSHTRKARRSNGSFVVDLAFIFRKKNPPKRMYKYPYISENGEDHRKHLPVGLKPPRRPSPERGRSPSACRDEGRYCSVCTVSSGCEREMRLKENKTAEVYPLSFYS